MANPELTTQQSRPQTSKPKRPVVARNGVDTPALFATIDAVKAQPQLAQFTFRASNRWLSGTRSRTRVERFDGAGTQHDHKQAFEYDADHPAVLCGKGDGPTPVEYLLGALAACLTAGIGNIAAARGIDLEEVESRVEGDVNLQGLLGIDDQVRNGYQGIRVSFTVKGGASAEELKRVVEQSKARSAVFDVLTHGVPVSIEVQTR